MVRGHAGSAVFSIIGRSIASQKSAFATLMCQVRQARDNAAAFFKQMPCNTCLHFLRYTALFSGKIYASFLFFLLLACVCTTSEEAGLHYLSSSSIDFPFLYLHSTAACVSRLRTTATVYALFTRLQHDHDFNTRGVFSLRRGTKNKFRDLIVTQGSTLGRKNLKKLTLHSSKTRYVTNIYGLDLWVWVSKHGDLWWSHMPSDRKVPRSILVLDESLQRILFYLLRLILHGRWTDGQFLIDTPSHKRKGEKFTLAV